MVIPVHVITILQKRREKQFLTGQEKEQLQEWLSSPEGETFFTDESWEKDLGLYLQFDADDQRMENSLQQLYSAIRLREQNKPGVGTSIPQVNAAAPVHRVHFLKKWGWAAASIILMLSIGGYLWTNHKKSTEAPDITATPTDVAPGKNGAILTLADGSQMVLDSLRNGVIASQNGAQVILKDDGLTYDPTGTPSDEVAYNTMTTPKGRQYKLMLPDGTKVWLNAASSITYPTVFAEQERKIDITGEAYFEVRRDSKRPFIVNTFRDQITVLGTSFNVNSYGDEPGKTTLVEGSVKINDRLLKPGQAYTNGSIENANIEKDIAWKEGLFIFEEENIRAIMRQLARWYDVEVAFQDDVQDVFVARIPRSVPLSQVLKALELTNLVHFKIEGKKITVMK